MKRRRWLRGPLLCGGNQPWRAPLRRRLRCELLEDRCLLSAKAWTVLVYLDGDNDLESAAIADFAEMAAVNNPNANIVVQFDRWAATGSPYDDTSYGNWTGTKRFLVAQGMMPTAANALADVGEVDMGNAAALRDFIDWGRAAYPADHYALDLWDHGGGWIDGVCYDESSGNTLSTAAIHQAVGDATANGANKIDLIASDACLMGEFEVACELKDYANYYVGSAELENDPGYLYSDILAPTHLTGSTTASAWAGYLVTSYGAQYASWYDDSTLAAVSLSNVNVTAADISSLANLLRNNISTERTNIDNAWYSCRGYSDDGSVTGTELSYAYADLYDFAAQLTSRTSNSAVKSQAQAVMNDLAGLIVAHWHNTAYSGSTANQRDLSIYFPADQYGGSYDDYNGSSLSFLADPNQHWDEFLDAYFNVYPQWPAFPFTGADNENTVYVNQNGDAALAGKSLTAGDIDGYVLDWNSAGAATVATTGATDTRMAYYPGSTDPTSKNDDYNGDINARITVAVPSAQQVGFCVAGYSATASGAYALTVNGPASDTIDTIALGADRFGTTTGSIDAAWHYHFYRFTTVAAGNYPVTLLPTGSWDLTLLVFDGGGNPVGGSFTAPINLGARGDNETWAGMGLAAAQTYYIRVDGVGASTGGFTLNVGTNNATPLPGDANLDGTVDINDLTIVLTNYNKSGLAWGQGDFTGDGTVDIADLTKVLTNYNHSLGASGAATRATAPSKPSGPVAADATPSPRKAIMAAQDHVLRSITVGEPLGYPAWLSALDCLSDGLRKPKKLGLFP